MDCKIINKLLLFLIFFTSTQLNAVEFKGKFLQGHYIIGITDPAAQIIIGKKSEGDLLEFKEIGKDPKNLNIEQITKILTELKAKN